MFDVAPQELLLLGAVAVAVIPPKDLPRAMRFAGQWIGKARGMARHFRSGLDEMVRQAELEEIEKKWREENERIMREHPLHDAIEHPVEPAALPTPEAASLSGMVAEPAPIEAAAGAAPPVAGPRVSEPAAELMSGPAPKRARAPRVAPQPEPPAVEDDNGPLLPFDLPPK